MHTECVFYKLSIVVSFVGNGVTHEIYNEHGLKPCLFRIELKSTSCQDNTAINHQITEGLATLVLTFHFKGLESTHISTHAKFTTSFQINSVCQCIFRLTGVNLSKTQC